MTNTWQEVYDMVDQLITNTTEPQPLAEAADVLGITESMLKSFAELNPNLVVDKSGVFRLVSEKTLSTPELVLRILQQSAEPLSAKEIAQRMLPIKPNATSGAIYNALSTLTMRGKIFRSGSGKGSYKYSLVEAVEKPSSENAIELAQQLVKLIDGLQTENKGLKQRLRAVNKKLETYEKAAKALKEV